MALLRKIKNKFIEKGPKGFLFIVFGKIQRTWRRSYFRVMGSFYEDYKVFHKSHFFKPQAIENFDLSLYPSERVLEQLLQNKYQILEGQVRSWGKTQTSGDLVWHKDLVQNFQWSKDVIGIDISIPFDQGDIKRPWEIGRLHQLVQLALCYRSFDSVDKKQQCLSLASFILTNFNLENPKFNGPQWMCAMDVGIRLANICLAADLFGSEFISKNQKTLNYQLAKHLFFIENNRENSLGTVVGNHYYANLCGLVFGYSHSRNLFANIHLNSVVNSMNKETLRQFDEQGGNFEGSTYYHRLSGELALFAYLCSGKTSKVDSRLEKILQFSEALSLSNGYMPQIGDNDSGHLFIFNPLEFQKNDLTHLGFIKAMSSLVRYKEKRFSVIIQNFLQPGNLVSEGRSNVFFGNEEEFVRAETLCSTKQNTRKYVFKINSFNSKDLQYFSFSRFGVFVCKNKDSYFSVRCGVNPVDDGGGHRHRDQLSIYLFSDGQNVVGRDPGSYIYTSDSAKRDLFRAAVSHNGPYLGTGVRKEKSTFEMEDQWAECSYFGPKGFFGKSVEAGTIFYRWVSFKEQEIQVIDWTEADDVLPEVDFTERRFSDRYGSYKDRVK